jgi:hypothetical protein
MKRQENAVHPRVLHEDAREVEVMPFADQRLLLGGEIARAQAGGYELNLGARHPPLLTETGKIRDADHLIPRPAHGRC